jgi:hypothetical protein
MLLGAVFLGILMNDVVLLGIINSSQVSVDSGDVLQSRGGYLLLKKHKPCPPFSRKV